MTLGDRVAILAFLAWALFAFVGPRVARWHERRRTLFGFPGVVVDEPMLLPFDCGCCGQDCPEGDTWCLACRPHVGTTGPLAERTYYSLHGVDCPYAARPIEETRLMPGAEQRDDGDEDQVAEGRGLVRPPRCERARPSRTTPLDLLPKTERDLWREALKAGL